MDFLILCVVGLIAWAIRSRRPFPRMMATRMLIGAAIGAITYTLLHGLAVTLWTRVAAGSSQATFPLRETGLRGAALGMLVGLCVAFLKLLPPRRDPRRRRPIPRRGGR